MAKKKEGEKEFVFPKFDEREFIEKERRNTKVTLITIGYAVLVGFLSFLISRFMPVLVPVAFLLGIFAIMNLRMFYDKLKIDISKFKKGNWIGNGMMTFFCWLAVWILLSNPPISDLASPHITHVGYYKVDNATVESGWLVPEEGKNVEFSGYGDNKAKPGDIILLKADIVDNYKLDEENLAVEVTNPDGDKESFSLDESSTRIRALFTGNGSAGNGSSASFIPFNYEDETFFFAYQFPNGEDAKGTYSFRITAQDSWDNKRSYTKKIVVD